MIPKMESETIEFKSVLNDNIKKEIVAFSNAIGGTIYIGINDDGSIAGIGEPDDVCLSISNMVRDSISPDLSMFISYEVINTDNKNVLKLNIQSGSNKPYFLKSIGLRPEGVYIRQGFSSVPTTIENIRELIKHTDGESFESMRTLNQDLTFNYTTSFFNKKTIPFDFSTKRTLGLLSKDNIYTNLAQLLSDQCSHTIKIAIFNDDTELSFQNRAEFGGSLFKQLEDTFSFINQYNETLSTFSGLYRIDNKSYPEIALREVLLNCLVHRDYSYSSSTFISIFPNKIEFKSIGGLNKGLTLNDIYLGISSSRNGKLSDVFFRLDLIEAFGTGITKIQNSYSDFPIKPLIETSDNVFKVTLPNKNKEPRPLKTKAEEKDTSKEILLSFAKTNGKLTRNDVERLLSLGQTASGRLLKELVHEGLLIKAGSARATYYYIQN